MNKAGRSIGKAVTEEEIRRTRGVSVKKTSQEIEKLRQDSRPRAVFLDLDGTLWDREVVPESAWKAIETARRNGHLIFVNTGRRDDSIPNFLWKANLDGYCLATGMDLIAGGRQIESHYMDRKAVEKLIEGLRENGSGYGLEGSYVGYDDPKYAFRRKLFYDKENREDPSARLPLSQMPDEMMDCIVKVIFDSETPFDLDALAEPLGFETMAYKNRFNPNGDAGSFFRGEITDARWNKARAMKSMLRALGLKEEDYIICALGDSENDLSMLEAADLGVCMGNGTLDAKQTADYVTDRIDQDGLYRAFDWLGMLNDQNEKNIEA